MSQSAVSARGVHTTWLYTLGSLVFIVLALNAVLIVRTIENFQIPRSALDALLAVVMLVSSAAAVRYCWFLRVGLAGGLPRPAWTVALVAPAAGVWVVGLFTSGGALLAAMPLWIAACLIAPLLARGPRRWLLAAAAAVTALHPIIASRLGAPFVLEDRGVEWLLIIYGFLLPVMVISGLWWWQIVVTMDRHRAAAAELAIAQERLRFAADLHDIQGHHLQVIALKAELAERLLERDPAAAREHLHETRLIAKRALEETRSLVAGYREVNLDVELENAREVLELSGAECELAIDELPDDAEVRRVLALVVREATTNILRHSSASRAAIRLSRDANGTTLSITNDRVQPGSRDDAASSGLIGLASRLAVMGGSLVDRIDGEHFTLTVVVPTREAVAS